MIREISSAERLQLLGLLMIARRHYKVIGMVENDAMDLLESEDLDHFSDAIYDVEEPNINKILKNMNITVKKDKRIK